MKGENAINKLHGSSQALKSSGSQGLSRTPDERESTPVNLNHSCFDSLFSPVLAGVHSA